MKNMIGTKLGKLLFGKKGIYGERMKRLMGTSNDVNEEYEEAFRTKSYIEICDIIQARFQTSLSSSQRIQLSGYLLEPDSLNSVLESRKLHPSILNYFQISQEACQACESLLQNVHQLRMSYRAIHHIIKFTERVPSTSWSQDQYLTVYRTLASFAIRKNPLSTMNPKRFQELHSSHLLLLNELTSHCLKTRKRSRFIRRIKRVVPNSAPVDCGSLGLIPGSFCLFWTKKRNRDNKKLSKPRPKKVVALLDAVGRGVYTMINDFNTMCRLVQRPHDEMEHMKLMAGICVVKKRKNVILKVVQEFQIHESWFLGQLEDLEKQIYLCFLDINRTRRLVVQELVK